MKRILFLCGAYLGIIFPNHLRKIKKMFLRAFDYIYTGWCSRDLKHIGLYSKFCYPVNLVGKKNIYLADKIVIGGGTSITAFCIDSEKDKTVINIGNNCMIGNDTHITAVCGIIIGENLRTGKNVLISDNAHGNPHDRKLLDIHPNDRPLYTKGPIRIGSNVWIGEKAAILGGVSIGDGAIIGANTVVTHDIPAYSIAVGCPARIAYINQ